jgi:hypothetical protein
MDLVKTERVSSYLGDEKTSLIGSANLIAAILIMILQNIMSIRPRKKQKEKG